jgi:hypothetical protein
MLWWQYLEWRDLLLALEAHPGYPPDEYTEWRNELEAAAVWCPRPPPVWRAEALAWGVPARVWDPDWEVLVALAENK